MFVAVVLKLFDFFAVPLQYLSSDSRPALASKTRESALKGSVS